MKALAAYFILFGCLASCAPGGGIITLPKSGKIEVRDSNFAAITSIQKSDDVGFIVASIRNAHKVGDAASLSHGFSHKLDLADRWLYDTETGDLVLLTKAVTSVYRVRDEDRARFESLLKPRGVTHSGF